MKTSDLSDIRPSPISGTWYPGKPEALKSMVEDFFEKAATPKFEGEIVGLIVPHAGLIYSGLTAAHAIKAVEGLQIDRVILLSPSHQPYYQQLLTTGHEAYSTPLGAVPVDREGLEFLSESLHVFGIEVSRVRNDREHSLEIELPLLQVILPEGFKLIPLMLRDQTNQLVKSLSIALAKLVEKFNSIETTLLVATSDLSHFYTEKQANLLDQRVIDALLKFDPLALERLSATGRGQACGHGPMAAVMLAAKQLGADQVALADYRTSAAVTGDRSSVVGYASAVIYRSKKAND